LTYLISSTRLAILLKCRLKLYHPFHDNGTPVPDAGPPPTPADQDTPLDPPLDHPVYQVMDEAKNLVASKAHDYAATENVFSNFENVASQVGIPVSAVFHSHIINKTERIRQLLEKGLAKHESLEDSLMDLSNYALLWVSWMRGQDGS